MFRRLSLAALAACALVLSLAAPTSAATSFVPQKECRRGTFATWKVVSKRGALRAVCVDEKPTTVGINIGAGYAYAPRCPRGMTAATDYTADNALVTARCERKGR